MLEQVISVARTRCKDVCEKVVGSFLGSGVRDLICGQNFPGSAFLRVAVHSLDAPSFSRIEAAGRAAGSGTMRLWIVGRLLRLMIRTSWSLVECDSKVSGLFSKVITMCCEVLPRELTVEDGGPAVVECGEALIAGVWLALGGSIQWGLRIEAGRGWGRSSGGARWGWSGSRRGLRDILAGGVRWIVLGMQSGPETFEVVQATSGCC